MFNNVKFSTILNGTTISCIIILATDDSATGDQTDDGTATDDGE